MKTIPLLLTTEEVIHTADKDILYIASSKELEKANESKLVLSFVGWAEHQLILQNKETYIICSSPYQLKDIVYVRETSYKTDDGYIYRSDYEYLEEDEQLIDWISANKMPREAVRTFYEVVDIDYIKHNNTLIEDTLMQKDTFKQRYAWRVKLKRINKPKDFILWNNRLQRTTI
ncbi:hypothetical protein HX056_00875 [Myroides odoratimimus]|uniref:hypothetical protein n=1 Tax=Myroides odoratimimus TaxID=76832 RepID=UPI0025780D0D|nr:hypothetical protein [Myroides odoratimimus]MDM1441891.1 hypothetical protein [Myroides odoratimimus]